MNELVNSNDNHVHTIIVELCVEVDHHKEESTSRIKADSDDRNAIRDKLETCVDPLDVSQGQHLINSVTRKISNNNVNVENAVQFGEAQLQEFESVCPTGFYQTIRRKVITMKEGNNSEERIQWNSVTQD